MRPLVIATGVVAAACGEEPGRTVAVALVLNGEPTGSVVSFQDGDGPWQHAPASLDGTYEISISSSTYAFAWGCVSPDVDMGEARRHVEMIYASTDDHAVVSGEVRCVPRQPAGTRVDSVSTACDGDQMVSTWALVAGASTYVWDAAYIPRAECGSSRAICPVSWSVNFAVSESDWSPRFELPPIVQLAGWSTALAMPCMPDVVFVTAQ